jgi:uncharacterized protein YcbX
MPKFTISEINIFPIKSLGGISVQEVEVEERGLQYDRRWVLADAHDTFMTQRENEKMALIEVKIEADGLKVSHKTLAIEPLKVPFQPQTSERKLIKIWDDNVEGIRVADEADEWFSKVLAKKCHLYYQPDDSFRKIDAQYAITHEEHTSFSDGYPILMIGQASLEELNNKLEKPIEMKRFRANLVFQGGNPFEEDNFKGFGVGSSKLVAVKPCARCILTTIDPETGEKGKEPLKTLSEFRKKGNKILFGQNIIVHQIGKIKIGDELFFN